MIRRTLVLLLTLAFVSTGAFAANWAVNADAAIDGAFGFEVLMNGDTQSAFVFDDTPDNETVYRAQFKIDWNDLAFAANSGPTSNLGVFKLWDMDQPAPLPRQFLTIGLRRGGDENRKIFAKIINFDGVNSTPTWRNEANSPMEINLPSGPAGYPVIVRVEFTQGTTTGPGDGVVSLARATNFDPTNFNTKTHSEVENDVINVDRAQLGATAADADSTGSFYLDSFESFRTLAP